MSLDRVCAGIRERVAAELLGTDDPGAREALLIAALYETSRNVLAELGSPKKSPEYLKAQQAASELLSAVAIPLVREGSERGVAVLSELAEGCQDPLLKKKLSVYAQELLARSGARRGKRRLPAATALRLLGVAGVAAALWLCLPANREKKAGAGPAAPEAPKRIEKMRPGVPEAAQQRPPGRTAALPGPELRQAQALPENAQVPALALPEKATRFRIVNGQILVPVLLKHGGAAVRLELVLDTGATRTTVHESAAAGLPIDPGDARVSLAEVADGRTIRSKIVRLDQLTVGPFAHGSMELELIPYAGKDAAHDGLLGMDFLARHRHQIDMEHQLIRWF